MPSAPSKDAAPAEQTARAQALSIDRGDRLRPWRGHRLYWHLTCLRTEIERVIREHLAGRSKGILVDLGCGNTPYRPLFEPVVEKYLACDLPGNELADCYLDEEGHIPLEDESADVVLSSQVLEHVLSPSEYLAEAYRALQTEGLLILSTHGVWRYHPDPTDFWRWTCDGLKRIVTEAGFEVVDFRGVMGPEATALQLLQDSALRRLPRRLRNLYTRYMQWRIARADRHCPQKLRDQDACVYFVIAKKS